MVLVERIFFPIGVMGLRKVELLSMERVATPNLLEKCGWRGKWVQGKNIGGI